MKLNKPKFWDVPKISFWAIILLPLSFIFLLTSFIRKTLKIENKFQIPIICVGNIYIGGTGKTPLSILITKELMKHKKRPALIKKEPTGMRSRKFYDSR